MSHKKSNHQSRNSLSRSLVFPLTMSDRFKARVYFQVCGVWHHASSVFTLNHARTEYFWKWKKKCLQTNVHIHEILAKMRVRESRSTRWISLNKRVIKHFRREIWMKIETLFKLITSLWNQTNCREKWVKKGFQCI